MRACALHVGAASAAASLRRDLVNDGLISEAQFDEAFGIARLTPGTNLLAMVTLLGLRLNGWRGAVAALAVTTAVPGTIAAMATMVYVSYASHPAAARSMQGARAGALAVLLWASVRLLLPQFSDRRVQAASIALAVLMLGGFTAFPQYLLLLVAGAVGAVLLRIPS